MKVIFTITLLLCAAALALAGETPINPLQLQWKVEGVDKTSPYGDVAYFTGNITITSRTAKEPQRVEIHCHRYFIRNGNSLECSKIDRVLYNGNLCTPKDPECKVILSDKGGVKMVGPFLTQVK